MEQLGEASIAVEQRSEAPTDPHVPAHARVLHVLRHHVVALFLGHLLQGQLVVVPKEDGPLAVVGNLRRLGQDLGDWEALLAANSHEQARHQGEVEAHVALVAVAEVVDEVGGPLVGLGQEHPVGMRGVYFFAELTQQR